MLHGIAATIAALLMAGFYDAVVVVRGPQGATLSGVSVTFVDAQGAQDAERTRGDGRAQARAGFSSVSALIVTPGYAAQRVQLTNVQTSVVLERDPKVIGLVRVATLSPRAVLQLPVATSFLDSAAIRTSSALTTDRLLRSLPGFDRSRSNSAFSNYGQLRVSFSGGGNDRGIVLVDGVPAQDGFGGQVDWSAYPPGLIGRAELLRAGGSALYGSNAVAGALQLYTLLGDLEHWGPRGFAAYSAGTHGTVARELYVTTGLSAVNGFSLYMNRWRSSYDDLPANFSSLIDTPADSVNAVTTGELSVQQKGTTLRLSAATAHDAQFEGRPNYEQRRAVTQYSGSFSGRHGKSVLSLTAFARHGLVSNVADQYPTAPGALRYTQDVPTQENGASATWLRLGGNTEFQLRADVRSVSGATYQYFPSGALQNSSTGSQWLGGIAMQQLIKRPALEILAGVRVDQVSTFARSLSSHSGHVNPTDRLDNAISPRLAIRFDVKPQISLRLSTGGGFRVPFLNEQLRGFQIGSTVYAPNPKLIPERSWMSGAGISAAIGTGLLSYNYAHIRVNDAIAFLTQGPTLQMRANIARTQTDASTLEYTMRFARCARLRSSFTRQLPRVIAGPATIVGKQLPFIPQMAANIDLDSDGRKVQAGVDVSFVGRVFADDINAQPLNPAVLLGFRVTTMLPHASLSFSADNLTNRSYLSSVDRLGPPATYTLRLEQRFGKAQDFGAADCNSRDDR
ncbi:MAG: TonB-dependent receptor [Candidatus Eremiobacteraeota bacterium]|nr:TonB-dependent receptor [Candidatus Eremiobacteraeota bacterium]